MKEQTINYIYLIVMIILALTVSACALYVGWFSAASMGGV